MTRHRGYREKPSKYGEELNAYLDSILETPDAYGKTIKKDVIVRESPEGKVVDVIFFEGTRVKMLKKLDSKWVQVTTPSGLTGVAGAQFIKEE